MRLNQKIYIFNQYIFIFLIFTTILISASCSSPRIKEESRAGELIDTSAVIIKYHNSLFTIPSPYQATLSIHKSGLSFNKSLLNPVSNNSNYTTNFDKALNLGIYGTDLGYLNMFHQTQDLFRYFSVIKDISKDLNLTDAIDPDIIGRVENNIDKKDTLIQFISNTYYSFDSYLKENNREELGVLIVTGSWIESLYILSQCALESDNREIINRLGEQKHPLDNLIEILSPYYYISERHSDLLDELVDLAYEFDGIIFNYTYDKPKVIPEQKLTIVNCSSNVVISEYHIKTIANKISAIRNEIIY